MKDVTATAQVKMDVLQAVGSSSVYLMGFSFVIGSLFTILVLLILDFVRRNKEPSA